MDSRTVDELRRDRLALNAERKLLHEMLTEAGIPEDVAGDGVEDLHHRSRRRSPGSPVKPYGYATITYRCVKCGWEATIRTRTDPGHSVTYAQAIEPNRCLRCLQRREPEAFR